MDALKMKNHVFFGIILSFAISSVFAVKTTEIQMVRLQTDGRSSELSASEQGVIKSFWENALNTMQLTDDVQEVVEIRRQIEQQKSIQPLSAYAAAYISTADDYLKIAFDNVSRIEEDAKRQLLEQNLMILAANLESPKLASMAIERMDQKDSVVRYWAVKTVTNAGVIQSLSDEIMADEDTKVQILNALQQRIEFEQQSEIQTMIIQFCAAVNHPTARDILLAIADQRIAAYMDWSVDREIMDAKLLIALGSTAMMQSDAGVKSDFARKFAELYSLVFQRYTMGQKILSGQQIDQNISVIAEVNDRTLKGMLNVSQTGVLIALKQKRGLDRVYEKIFGDRMRSGDLAAIYKFDYGKDATGKAITEPPKLPAPVADGVGAEG